MFKLETHIKFLPKEFSNYLQSSPRINKIGPRSKHKQIKICQAVLDEYKAQGLCWELITSGQGSVCQGEGGGKRGSPLGLPIGFLLFVEGWSDWEKKQVGVRLCVFFLRLAGYSCIKWFMIWRGAIHMFPSWGCWNFQDVFWGFWVAVVGLGYTIPLDPGHLLAGKGYQAPSVCQGNHHSHHKRPLSFVNDHCHLHVWFRTWVQRWFCAWMILDAKCKKKHVGTQIRSDLATDCSF